MMFCTLREDRQVHKIAQLISHPEISTTPLAMEVVTECGLRQDHMPLMDSGPASCTKCVDAPPATLGGDLQTILQTGVTHTGRVIELLEMRGWTHDQILPVIYKALLKDLVSPNGIKTPFRGN